MKFLVGLSLLEDIALPASPLLGILGLLVRLLYPWHLIAVIIERNTLLLLGFQGILQLSEFCGGADAERGNLIMLGLNAITQLEEVGIQLDFEVPRVVLHGGVLIQCPYGIGKHGLILDHLQGPICEGAQVAHIGHHVCLEYLNQFHAAV